MLLIVFAIVFGHQVVPHIHEDITSSEAVSSEQERSGLLQFLVEFYSCCDSGVDHLEVYEDSDGPEFEACGALDDIPSFPLEIGRNDHILLATIPISGFYSIKGSRAPPSFLHV